MVATHRTGMWGFIILLAALAFLRSLAPEHTERAVRGLMKTSNIPSKAMEEEKRHLTEMKDEIKRERIALEILKEKLDQKHSEEEDVQRTEEQSLESNVLENQNPSTQNEAISLDGNMATSKEENIEYNNHSTNGKEESMTQESYKADHDIAFVELGDDECPVVVAPEYSRSGLGTQIEHVWASLSVTLAVRNACAVLPPIVTSIGEEDVEIVPFHEIFDLDELGRTGLRILPLSVCQTSGVSHVFDDNGAESAIVNNFASYVARSHPSLAKQTTLVQEHTQPHRFPPIEQTEGDVNRVATYIASKRGEGQGRECIGFGRMRSAIAVNLDVVEHFKPAPSIDDYVSSKYTEMNQTLFVKLRWNQAHCDEKRNEDRTVCILSGEILSTDDYVHSIAYAATMIGASKIYISAPPHVPEEVSSQISSKLMPVDPVVLDVGSDFFTASVIEREMAVRSRAFVADGGAWGESVQEARRMHYPHLFREGYNSQIMVEDWRNAGSPTELPILMASYVHEHNKGAEMPAPATSAEDQRLSTETISKDGQQAEATNPQVSGTAEGWPDPGTANSAPEQPEAAKASEENGMTLDADTANEVPSQTETDPVNVDSQATPGQGASPVTAAQPEGAYGNAEAEVTLNHGADNVAPAQPEHEYVNAGAEVNLATIPETQAPRDVSDEARPQAYIPPQTYIPNEESDHHLFPEAQIPERKVVHPPQVVAGTNGQEAYVHQVDPRSGVVRIVSGDGGDNSPRQGEKGKQSP